MIESTETEPILDDTSYEPEPLEEPELPIEPESELYEPSDELDYERIIGGVTERIAHAARQYQAIQHQPPADPYAEVADMIWDNPGGAIQRTVDIATRNAIQAMMPYVQPVSQSFAMHQAAQGLDEEAQQLMHEYVHSKGINPALLNDPTVADLVRSKALVMKAEKSGRLRPIPFTESAGGHSMGNVDSTTQRELTGMEQLYRNLNLKFEPSKLLRRMK